MTPRPLDQIGLHWRDHKSALWWLALLYRRPVQFQEALQPSAPRSQLRIGLLFLLHALPYAVLPSAVITLLFHPKHASSVSNILGLIAGWFILVILGGARVAMLSGIVGTITLGFAGGIALGVVAEITYMVAGMIENKTCYEFSVQIACAISLGIALGSDRGLLGRILPSGDFIGKIGLAITLGISAGFYGPITKLVAFGITGRIVIGVLLVAISLRVYYHLVHPFFIWPTVHGRAYRFHPVAWDDVCNVPFPGLDRLLVAYSEQNRSAGEAEIERLIDSYPSQRLQALRAKVRLVAREAGRVRSLAWLNEIVAKLPEGEKGFLSQTRQLRQWVNDIAAVQTRLGMLERPIFREPTAQLLNTEIENFQHRIAGFKEPLASEFRKAAKNWQEIARRQLEQARAVVSKQPTPQLFRAGDPVDRDKEAFVPRTGIVGQLEQQVMLATGCPGLVLYGRKRTGKSTVLRNLSGFLPPSVIPVVLSMQAPKALASQRSFIHLIAWESGNKADVAGMPDEISGLYDFLANCNSRLQVGSKRLLLALDEYELIDSKIAEGVFTEDLLRMVRESIQSHRNITWIFSGSHEITELTGAPWTSYLVSARTIPVPVFKPPETRLLLTEPLKYSSFWNKKEEPHRPRFDPGFWGEGGIDRIHEEAGGWPHLVQLIAEAVVDLINDEEARTVTPALLDRALASCVVRGHNVLYELMRRECTLPGEWEYLSAFRRQPEQSAPVGEAVYRSLRRRDLITEANGYWRLRVPLMARWLRERG
jgi:hypothetical protein